MSATSRPAEAKPEIRAAGPGDLPAITAIYGEAVLNGTASYELAAPSLEEMTGRYRAVMEAELPYLVAVVGGAVAGYAYAGAFRPRPAYRFAVEDSIYVAADARGGGIGRLLLERLIAETTALGFRQLVAVIGDGHAESASVRLHERLGFSHAGRLAGTGYKHGRWLDTVFMQLALNEGAAIAPDPSSLPERRFRGERQ